MTTLVGAWAVPMQRAVGETAVACFEEGTAALRRGDLRTARQRWAQLDRRDRELAALLGSVLHARLRRDAPLPSTPEAIRAEAIEALASLDPAIRRGRSHVYVVELHGVHGIDERAFYVGMTGTTPEARYRAHLRGRKSGRGYVRDHGLGLLEGAPAFLRNVSRQDAERLEYEAHAALVARGLLAFGGH